MGLSEQIYNVFNQEGRLLQTEYALEAVNREYQVISLISEDEIIAISKKIPQPVLKNECHSSIYKIGDNMYLNITGAPADIDYVVDKCKNLCSEKEYSLDSGLSPDLFAKFFASKMQVRIQRSGSRAPAFAAAVMGFEDGKPSMYYTDTSAVEYPCFAMAAGEDYNKMTKYLEKNYQRLSKKECISIGVGALLQSIGQDAEGNEIEICVISKDGIEYYSNDQINQIILNIQGNN